MSADRFVDPPEDFPEDSNDSLEPAAEGEAEIQSSPEAQSNTEEQAPEGDQQGEIEPADHASAETEEAAPETEPEVSAAAEDVGHSVPQGRFNQVIKQREHAYGQVTSLQEQNRQQQAEIDRLTQQYTASTEKLDEYGEVAPEVEPQQQGQYNPQTDQQLGSSVNAIIRKASDSSENPEDITKFQESLNSLWPDTSQPGQIPRDAFIDIAQMTNAPEVVTALSTNPELAQTLTNAYNHDRSFAVQQLFAISNNLKPKARVKQPTKAPAPIPDVNLPPSGSGGTTDDWKLGKVKQQGAARF